MKESTRQSRSGFWAENLVRDIIYASRMLRRDLAFTLIAVVTLALGIGANGAAFSVMRALLFRSLPVPHPERLVRIGLDFSEQEILLSGPLFGALQGHANTFRDVMAWAEFMTFWEKTDSSQLVNVAVISGNGFSVLGLRPEFGRLLTPRDDTAGGGAGGFAAVVSERFWKSQLGGDVTALNRKLVLNHVPVTVVGVMPQNFEGLVIGSAPDLVLPLEYEVRANGAYSQRHFFGSTWLNVFGRRGESVTFGRAANQLAAIAPAVLKEAIPAQMQGALLPRLGLQIHPGYNGAVSESSFHGPTFRDLYRRPVFIVQALVAFLLLLCVTNLAALQFARAKAREREFAIRSSLGASRSRILAQLLAENTLIGIAGAGFGLVACYLISGALNNFLASRRWSLDTHPDSTVAFAVLAGGVICMVIAGLAPMVFPAHGKPRGKRGARLLIPLQVSVCMVLLVAAGLFLNTLLRLTNAPLGFDPEGVIIFPFEVGNNPAAMARNRLAESSLLRSLQSVPGISAALLDNPPIAGANASTAVQARGTAKIDRQAPLVSAGPGYLEVMRTRLMEGREFSSADTQISPPVCMLSKSAARYFFPGASAIGGRLVMPEPRSPAVPPQCEIVGVTEDSRYEDLRTESPRLVYINAAQSRFPASYILVRTNNAAEARREFARLSHNLLQGVDFFPSATLTEQIRSTIGRERLLGAVSSIFAALALLITGVGLYGFLAWSVVRRTVEIGIRVALGADQSVILWMIAKETFLLLFTGVVMGSLAAYFLSKLAASLLYATNPGDPVVFCGAVASLLVLGVLAASVPASRAAQLEPMLALRRE